MKKIYWRDIPQTGKVIDYGAGYTYNGLTVFWHTHESSQAQAWLDTRSKRTPTTSDIDAGELATMPAYSC